MGSGADSPCQGEMSRSDRGDRVGDYEHEVLIWSRPRRRFGDFAAVGKVTRRPQAAKPPCKKRNCSIIAPSSVWPDGQPPSPLGGRLFGGGSPHPAPSGAPIPIPSVASRHHPTPFGLRPFPPDRGNRPLDKGSRPPRGKALWGRAPSSAPGGRLKKGGELPRRLKARNVSASAAPGRFPGTPTRPGWDHRPGRCPCRGTGAG